MTGAGPARVREALHVFSTFGKGGPQVRTTQLIARMGAGWRHKVLAMDGRTEAVALLPGGQIEVELLPKPPGRSFLASVRAFQQQLQGASHDLVLTYNWGAIEAVVGARRAGVRALVHHEEGFGPEELPRRLRRRNWIRRLALRKVPAVVVPSRNLEAIAQREWKLRAPQLCYLPNGVDCERYSPAAIGPAESAPAAGGPFTVGTVGGLRGEKDQATLLRAVAAMQTEGARCVLVGDGPERGRYEALAGQLGLGERAVFAGPTDDPLASYRSFDAFCLSSRTEQMPLSLLEAMACGLPVAGTDVGDVRVMLPEGSRAGVVAAGDHEALARALDALAADPARRAREGAGNRARAVAEFELGTSLDRYIALYERLVGV